MSDQQWAYDEARRDHYRFDAARGVYIYASGTVIPYSAPMMPIDDRSAIPRYVDNTHNILGVESEPKNTNSVINPYVDVGGREKTDKHLAKRGYAAKGRLRGEVKGSPFENLFKSFPDYKRRKHPREFFIVGRVFKTLWPEMLGSSGDTVTTTGETKTAGRQFTTKVRWFVVVKSAKKYCTCLPISTYNQMGVAKSGVVKSEHCIAFSSRKEPPPDSDEEPTGRELPMLPGIRIKARRPQDKLDSFHRIDFARMYTVQHDVRVYEFGQVHKDYLDPLHDQWIHVLTHSTNEIGSDSDDEDEEEDAVYGRTGSEVSDNEEDAIYMSGDEDGNQSLKASKHHNSAGPSNYGGYPSSYGPSSYGVYSSSNSYGANNTESSLHQGNRSSRNAEKEPTSDSRSGKNRPPSDVKKKRRG